MRRWEYQAEATDADKRLSQLLYARLHLTRRQISRLKFQEGGICVNGEDVYNRQARCFLARKAAGGAGAWFERSYGLLLCLCLKQPADQRFKAVVGIREHARLFAERLVTTQHPRMPGQPRTAVGVTIDDIPGQRMSDALHLSLIHIEMCIRDSL